MNISGLKTILRSELSLYNEKKRQYEDAVYLKYLLEDLYRLINVESINELDSNMLGVSMLLPLIYGEEECNIIENKMFNIIYRLKNYYGKKNLINEYQKEERNLKVLLSRFINDLGIIQDKIYTYKKELQEKSNGQKYCRKILYRFNHGYVISNDLTNYIKNLLQERGYSQEQIIVTLEFLAHHNQRATYPNPRISHTVIKMIESNYPLFDLEELQDKEKKAKLDGFSYSAFDTLIEEENFETAKEFLNEMTSWMNDGEFEYAIKSIMNKFLEMLQICKNDMLEIGNYEDGELRKFIVDEFNNYYHKFKNIENYYYEKIKKEKVTEKIEIGGVLNLYNSKKIILFLHQELVNHLLKEISKMFQKNILIG